MPKNYFDERIAKSYEARWPELFDPAVIDPVVRSLADLAAGGSALELGIGTGRIAIPLTSQGLISHHYWVVDGQLETFSGSFRYVWPSERWSDWTREPFTSDSRQHVSVWEKPP